MVYRFGSASSLDSDEANTASDPLSLLVLTESGLAKKVPLSQYPAKGRATGGVVTTELVGKDKVEDKDVWRVRLTTKNVDVRYYLFDAKTFLLLKWEGKRRADGKEYPIESYFHDYRDVGGLKFAFEIDSGSSATDLTQKLVIDAIELNVNFADSDFAKPAAPRRGTRSKAVSVSSATEPHPS